MTGGDVTAASIPEATAHGRDDEFFHVKCPSCRHLTLVSLETRDGDLCDCDACSMGQFFFRMSPA